MAFEPLDTLLVELPLLAVFLIKGANHLLAEAGVSRFLSPAECSWLPPSTVPYPVHCSEFDESLEAHSDGLSSTPFLMIPGNS